MERHPKPCNAAPLGRTSGLSHKKRQIGEIQNGVTVITHGVKAGDRIVVTGQYSLTQGARITEANPAQLAQAQGE